MSKSRNVAVALVFIGLFLGTALKSQGAFVEFVTESGLSSGNYAEPAGVLQQDSINNLRTGFVPGTGRGVTGNRKNTQTFVVSEVDFPLGVAVTGFVINTISTSSAITFGVELFPVADPKAASLTASGPSLVSNPSTGAGSPNVAGSLTLGSSAAAQTVTFTFNEAVDLLPGAYAWQFIPTGTTTAAFTWERQSGSYAPGGRHELDLIPSFSDGADMNFGLIGTQIVPEPTAFTLAGVATLAGLGLLRARKHK